MKRFLAIILTLSIALSISMSVFAEGKATVTSGKILRLPEITSNAPINIPVGDAEYIEDSNGKLIKISDLMHFSNQQEADNYLAQLSKQLSKTVQYNPQISTATRSTHGDALVASKGVSTGTIELRVAYSTSGDSMQRDFFPVGFQKSLTVPGFAVGIINRTCPGVIDDVRPQHGNLGHARFCCLD